MREVVWIKAEPVVDDGQLAGGSVPHGDDEHPLESRQAIGTFGFVYRQRQCGVIGILRQTSGRHEIPPAIALMMELTCEEQRDAAVGAANWLAAGIEDPDPHTAQRRLGPDAGGVDRVMRVVAHPLRHKGGYCSGLLTRRGRAESEDAAHWEDVHASAGRR